MQKPYRFVLDRVSSYAEEGAAFLRRRRHRARAYARVWHEPGVIEAYDRGDPDAAGIFDAAGRILADSEAD